MTRAATTRLEPGQHSIDRSTPYRFGDGWRLRWRIRLHSGKLMDMSTKGRTKGATRARAKAKAAELLAVGAGSTDGWTPRSDIAAYMEARTLPAIRSDRLSPETVRRYSLAYRLLRGECHDAACKHTHALTGLSIHDAMRPRQLASCLQEIGEKHGAKNVKHARIVASKYLARPLKLDELIEHNPLTDLDIELDKARQPERRRGGQALSLDEYQRAVEWLLAADPADASAPKRGRWTLEHAVTARATAIDLILAQATTGCRVSELANRPAGDFTLDKTGTIIIQLSAEATKTRRGRPVPVLDPRVSARLAARLKGILDPSWPMFPAASDPSKAWQPRTRDRKLAEIYLEMAEALDIPLLEFERGHLWRSTLNTLLYEAIPEATRTRLLGHSPAVNRSHYTATTSTEAVVQAAAVLRQPPQGTR